MRVRVSLLEAEALATPLAKAAATLQEAVPQPPDWLESGLVDAADALVASRERLRRREEELERLGAALELRNREEEEDTGQRI